MGIETLICNCNSLMYRKYRQFGFHFSYMGSTKEFNHGQVHCLAFDISRQNLDIFETLQCKSTNRLTSSDILIDGSASALAWHLNTSDCPFPEGFNHQMPYILPQHETGDSDISRA